MPLTHRALLPLLLHAPGKFISERRRRILHIEYAGFRLPEGLVWNSSARVISNLLFMDRDTTFGLLAFGMMMIPVVTVCFHALSEPDSLPGTPVRISTWIAGAPLGAFIGVALTLITFKVAGWFLVGTTIPLMGFLAVPVVSFVAAYGILRFCPYLKVY